jgi:RNase P subunit RPR2
VHNDHLCCEACGRVLIAQFWQMVRTEHQPTFLSVSVPCGCGRQRLVAADALAQARRPGRPAARLPV